MPSKALLGRLPPLHSLGKACSVDFGEDGPFTESPDDSSPTPLDSSGTSRGAYDVSYGPEEAESTAAALGNCFRLVEPGSHVIKRSGRGCDHNDIRFIHSPRAVDLGRKHRDLQLLLTGRAHLQFLRDCVMRIQAVQSFTFYVQDLVKCELLTWRRVSTRDVTSAVESRLDALSAICEDLRVHVNHWRMTQQRYLTDKWLQQSSKLSHQIQALRSVYARLESTAIWWVGQFISVGMRVLPHSDLSRLSQSDLWQITKGIEEFNAIVSMSSNSLAFWRSHHLLHRLAYPSAFPAKEAPALFPPAQLCADHLYLTHPYLTQLALSSFLSSVMREIPVSYLLNIMASERAKYVAAMVHSVITSNAELRAMASQSRHVSFDWETLLGPDERFATPSSAAATPPSHVAAVGNDAGRGGEVGDAAGTTTASSMSPSAKNGVVDGAAIAGKRDKNKRQTKRGHDKRNQRPSSPFGGESSNGRTSDYWSATTTSSTTALPTQVSSTATLIGGLLVADRHASKPSSAFNKTSTKISAGQASKVQDASKYCVQQLVTMARHEEDFASEFLTTLSHCTTLMHKPRWEDSLPMETLRKAGLADIESMLPQQIPLPGKTKKEDRISFADDDMSPDSTTIDTTTESLDFLSFNQNQKNQTAVITPVDDLPRPSCKPRLDGSVDAPPPPAVVVVQSASTMDSSSDLEEASDRQKRLTGPQLLQVPDPSNLLPGGGGASSSSPKKKSVSWSDSADLALKLRLSGHFMDLLWLHIAKHLLQFLHELNWRRQDDDEKLLGHVTFLDDVIIVTLSYTISQLCSKEHLPPGALLVLEKVSQQLLLSRAASAWDEFFCSALASTFSDKGQPIPLVASHLSSMDPLLRSPSSGRKTCFGSSTGKKFRDAFQPMLAALSLVCSRLSEIGSSPRSPSDRPEFSVHEISDVLKLFSRLLLTVGTAVNWLHTKTSSCLSSWSVGQFLLTTQSDLKMLTDCVKSVMALKQRLTVCLQAALTMDLHIGESEDWRGSSLYQMNDSASRHPLVEFLQKLSTQLSAVSDEIQMLSSTAMKQFSTRCNSLAAEFFAEAIPGPKFWRKKAPNNNELPTAPSRYVEEASFALVLPIVEGSKKLSPSSQIAAISMAVSALANAWMEVLLKRKIRFSLYGAQQLYIDYQFLRRWLESQITHGGVRQSVLNLDSVSYVKGVCFCLMRQPANSSRVVGKISNGVSSKTAPLCRTHRVSDSKTGRVVSVNIQRSAERNSPEGTYTIGVHPPLDDGIENDLHSSPSALIPGTRAGNGKVVTSCGQGSSSGKRDVTCGKRDVSSGRAATCSSGLKGSSQQSLLGVFDEGSSEGGTLRHGNERLAPSSSDYGCSATEDDAEWPSDTNKTDGEWARDEVRRGGGERGAVVINGSATHGPSTKTPIKASSDWWDEFDGISQSESAVEAPPNADEWLALRVVGGARSWSLPNFPRLKCFSNGSQ